MTQPPNPGPWGAPQQQPAQPGWQQPHPGPGGPQHSWHQPGPQPWPGQQQQPYYGPPNPLSGFPPPKRSGIKPWMVIVGVIAVLALISGVANMVLKANHRAEAAGDLKTGQCLTTDDMNKFHFRSTSCDSLDAVYELAGLTAMGICPDGKRVQDGPYFYATKNSDDPKAESMCFALNMRQSECYSLDMSEKIVTHIDCAQASTTANSHTGVFKVAKRVDGSSTETVCVAGEKAMIFTVPERVYCLAKLVE
ncbi:proline-rich domain-containing protein [Mycolicibacterium sp. CBMA 226]|uniref:proline-rich domain-containing protein n=1 Tax=Mycolicibacterium sp. CBMA 226 TaxID=2606611 RepID=UPI0012DE8D78|nr:proline-rich domain-containing protein [Mycolicibacterium sp. CBMA 226]MUL78850.1 hypothetical protein [Mycolicibacterium sp. CBMA 226]QGW61147.1 hypothetical protein ICEMyc226_00115 [Mycolicibacterium sp.]